MFVLRVSVWNPFFQSSSSEMMLYASRKLLALNFLSTVSSFQQGNELEDELFLRPAWDKPAMSLLQHSLPLLAVSASPDPLHTSSYEKTPHRINFNLNFNIFSHLLRHFLPFSSVKDCYFLYSFPFHTKKK